MWIVGETVNDFTQMHSVYKTPILRPSIPSKSKSFPLSPAIIPTSLQTINLLLLRIKFEKRREQRVVKEEKRWEQPGNDNNNT